MSDHNGDMIPMGLCQLADLVEASADGPNCTFILVDAEGFESLHNDLRRLHAGEIELLLWSGQDGNTVVIAPAGEEVHELWAEMIRTRAAHTN